MNKHNMNYHELRPQGGNPIESIVVFVHGYGADGQDLISIGHIWQQFLPNTYFMSPDAPFPYEGGGQGRQWFGLMDRSIETMRQGLQHACPHIEALIEGLKDQYQLHEDNIALVGFSQGSMISLSYALNHSKKLAGVIAYSGAYVPEVDEPKSMPDVLMIHGAQDDVLPLDYYLNSKENLEKQGVNVTGHIRENLAHGIDDWGIETGYQFLRKKLYK